MTQRPPFLHKDPRSAGSEGVPVPAVQYHSRGDVAEARALWWPPEESVVSPTTILYLIPGNPGQVEYFHYFLDYLHKLHPELGILAKAHLGHTPGYSTAHSKQHYGLLSQVDSALETVRSLKETYPKAKIVLVGHSIGGWISTKLLEADPRKTEAAFLLMPGLSNLATTPNGVKLAWLFWPISALFAAVIGPILSLLPLTIFRMILSEWPDQQLTVVRAMLRSPSAITSALGMARDEMAMVRDLDVHLLKSYSEKIYLYCASKDDWVGKEKDAVISALGGPSERIVQDTTDTPHAFVITKRHSHRVAEQCSLWLQGRGLVRKRHHPSLE